MRLGRVNILGRHPIGDPADPYMVRWSIVKTPWFGLCVHRFLRSDYERALHDHPWWFLSLVLAGGYVEVHEGDHAEQNAAERTVLHAGRLRADDPRPAFTAEIGALAEARTLRRPGSVAFRHAKWRHRVELLPSGRFAQSGEALRREAWTLVLMGPRSRRWGFWVDSDGRRTWCWWRRHNQQLDICEDRPIHVGGED